MPPSEIPKWENRSLVLRFLLAMPWNSHNQIENQTGHILVSRHVKQGHDKISKDKV